MFIALGFDEDEKITCSSVTVHSTLELAKQDVEKITLNSDGWIKCFSILEVEIDTQKILAEYENINNRWIINTDRPYTYSEDDRFNYLYSYII